MLRPRGHAIEPAVGQCWPLRGSGASALAFGGAARVRRIQVEGGQKAVDLAEAGNGRQRRARLAADRIPLEVPRDVLADVAASAIFVLEELDQQLGVPAEGVGDESERRVDGRGGGRAGSAERAREVAEQPGPAQASAPDHDAVAAGLVHHARGVLGGPDVSVAEDGDARDRLLEGGDGGPVRLPRVELGRGARVEGDGRHAGVLGDASGVEVREVVGVDALAHLHRQRDVAGRSRRSGDDLAEELELPGKGGAAALARHFRDRASEVQVDVVGPILLDEDAHRTLDGRRVDSVQLDRSRRLGLVMRDQAHRRGVALHERTRGDHLADVQAGAVLAAQAPERRVRDSRHRGEHDRRVELDGPDAQRARGREGGGHRSILPDARAPRSRMQA